MAHKKDFGSPSIAGQNFHRLMQNKGYTQQQFSEEFGVDVRTIRRWYKWLDSLTTIIEIASFFDVDVEDVLSPNRD